MIIKIKEKPKKKESIKENNLHIAIVTDKAIGINIRRNRYIDNIMI